MNAILTDSHLETEIELYCDECVTAPKLGYAGEVWEGEAEFVEQLKTVQTTEARNILGYSQVGRLILYQ